MSDEQARPHFEVIDNQKYDMVQMLERFLASAKAGELDCIAIAGVYAGDRYSITTGWSVPSFGNHSRLTGAVSHMEYRLNRSLDESYCG